MENNNIKNANDLISKIQKKEPLFYDCKYTENQYLKKYNYILSDNAKERLDRLYTYIKQNPSHH